MDFAIECRDLCHRYGRKPALRGVSWSLKPGRICGLLGRNGAGKTTTINILNSFLVPESGSCKLLGEDSHSLSPTTKARIGYLIEGHVQYGFFNVEQIERFYSAFYPKWDASIYYHLISRLDIGKKQKISTMSCGQRSQVALGLILAQKPDLIVFDDYSMGLDPGYRRLFIDVIRDYAADGKRSILLTSHIIQDLEGLIDDCIIYDKGRVLVDTQTERLSQDYRRYSFTAPEVKVHLGEAPDYLRVEQHPSRHLMHGFVKPDEVAGKLAQLGIAASDIKEEKMTLEDIFIALTGKY